MPKSATDVFLLPSANDCGVAALVNSAIHQAGLKVVMDPPEAPNTTQSRTKRLNVVRKEIMNSRCVVMLLTPNSADSPNVLVEVGMAIGAAKPIFVLHEGLGTRELPDFIQHDHVAGLEHLPKVVAEIKALTGELAAITPA